jgi:hypothetical protein
LGRQIVPPHAILCRHSARRVSKENVSGTDITIYKIVISVPDTFWFLTRFGFPFGFPRPVLNGKDFSLRFKRLGFILM